MGQLTITPEGYAEIKSKIKDKLNETTNNFIIIGYYLKQVRDSGAYIQDGYHNMEEFAQGEYRLSASTASRFMDINTRFSEDGNSLQIKAEYCNYGYSKLQEMLTVKENDIELITPATTVAQIREIKKAEKEEDQEEARAAAENLPLVKMTQDESAEETQEDVATSQKEYSPLEKILIELWKDRPAELLSGIRGGMITGAELAEELSPSGSKTFTSGTYMLFMYTENIGMKFRYYANGKANIETYTYDEIIEITNNFITDELFREITANEKKNDETALEQETTVQKPIEKKQMPPVVKPAQGKETEDTYKPLPGQMTLTGEQPQTEMGRTIENIERQAFEQAVAQMQQESEPAADAEYKEIPEELEYTQVEINNAIGYFETEYKRMEGMGINSTKSRNYKMALDAIRKVYGEHETA